MEIRTKLGGFTEAFKIHVVEELESGRLSQAAAKRKYDILGHSTVLKWCRKYGRMQFLFKPKVGKMEMTKESQETLYLKNEIKALKQELEDARMKTIVWETLVDIAEKELGIPIRKKYGARQSGQSK